MGIAPHKRTTEQRGRGGFFKQTASCLAERRVLLMYVHEHSGHHQAALALQKAFEAQSSPRARILLVDALRFMHPFLERLIRHTYLEIVKKKPDLWEYLYDNPRLVKSTIKIRQAVGRSHSKRLESLLSGFKPTEVVCTQAFPCGIISDFKATHPFRAPLYGVLTDYLPHSYWLMDHVDRYFVPCEEAKGHLMAHGVSGKRILITGIPIDSRDLARSRRSAAARPGEPVVLVMGGSQGLGPIEKIVRALEDLSESFEITILTGKNKKLFTKLKSLKKDFHKKVHPVAYTENIRPYFQSAAVLITKPGGLTIAQALASKIPVIFIDPIPGQEANNASILLKHRAALEAQSEKEAAWHTAQLLKFPDKARAIKKNMETLARPNAARDIAKQILNSG